MLRRQPSKIEVKIEDKEELEEARKRAAAVAAAAAANTTTAASSLLQNLNRNKDPPSKAQRLGMEVEVKLRLPDAATHCKVTTLLSSFHVKTHRQENFFFDGSNGELSARRAVLRIRFYDGDALCVISLKARAVLIDGVSRVEEDEEELEPSVGRACVEDPQRLITLESRILGRAKDEFGVSGFVGLGGFGNVRGVFEWNGLKLEVDETSFGFGILYEIECESTDPDAAKKMLEDLLKENGIAYSYSAASKFAIFRSGKLP